MLRCLANAKCAARARACRRGKGYRPVVGLGSGHKACEAAVVRKPCREGASGAPAGVGRTRRRHGSIVPCRVWAACLSLLLRVVAVAAGVARINVFFRVLLVLAG